MFKFLKKFWMFVLATLVTVLVVSCTTPKTEVTITIEGLKDAYEFNTGDEFNKDILLQGIEVLGTDGKDYSEYLEVTGLERFKVVDGKLTESGTGNVKIEVIVDGKVVASKFITVTVKYVAPVTDDIIINGDFASGSVDPFTKGEFNGGTGEMSVVNEELKLTVLSLGWAGGGEAAPRVETNVFALENGKFYELAFDIRANVETSVQVQIGELLTDAPWFNETFTKVFAVSTTMETITYRFMASETAGYDITKLQLLFGFGTHTGFASAATDVFMDNISITEVSSLGEDTEAPVITASDVIAFVGDEVVINYTVKDNQDAAPVVTTDADKVIPQEAGKYTTVGEYEVTITATDKTGNSSSKTVKVSVNPAVQANVNLIPNGSFESATFPSVWEFYGAPEFGCTVAQQVVENQLVLTLAGNAEMNWHRQVKVNQLPIVQGKKYAVSVVLTSSIDRKVQILVQNDQSWEVHYETVKEVKAGEEVVFEGEFTALPTSNNVFIGLMLGSFDEQSYSAEHTVTIKSASIKLVDGGSSVEPEPEDPSYADENNLFGTPSEVVWGGAEDSTKNPNKLYVWNVKDPGWNCGPVVNTTFELVDGVLSLVTSQTAEHYWFANQVFYTTLPIKNGGEYEASFTIKTNVAGNITVNGKVVTLAEGENQVVIPVTIANGQAIALSAQFGVEGEGALVGEIQAEFSAFKVEAKQGGSTPVEPEPEEPAYADENNLFGTPSEAVFGEEVVSKKNPGKFHIWYVQDAAWNCGPVANTTYEYVNGVLTITTSQTAEHYFWANQLFYSTLPFKNAGNYELHLTINSSVVGKIRINGADKSLVLGENQFVVAFTATANQSFNLSIQLGTETNGALVGEDIVLAFTKFEIVPEEVSSDEPVDGGEAIVLAKGASETKFDGPFAYIWVDADSIEMTAANSEKAKATATVTVDPKTGWSVRNITFSDFDEANSWVRVKVELSGAPVAGFKTNIVLEIVCNGKKFTATIDFDGTSYVDPNGSTEEPVEPSEPVEGGKAVILANGASATRVEGAGAWIWVDTASIEMTGANFSSAKVTATCEVKGPEGEDIPWTVNQAFFSDLGATYVRVYVILTGGPVAGYKTTISLDITSNGKKYTATVQFDGTSYVDPNASTEEPTPDPEPVEEGTAVILANGASATRFEGAGAWIWVDTASIEMTGENFSSAKVTATCEVKGPAGEDIPWTVNQAFFSDLGATYVRVYVVLTGGPVAGYETTIYLDITSNGKTFTATVNFSGTQYVA